MKGRRLEAGTEYDNQPWRQGNSGEGRRVTIGYNHERTHRPGKWGVRRGGEVHQGNGRCAASWNTRRKEWTRGGPVGRAHGGFARCHRRRLPEKLESTIVEGSVL